jgi:hypothetical protein
VNRAAVAAAQSVIATRLPVLLVGAVVVTFIGTIPPPVAEALWRVSSNELGNLLARWDTAYYYSIATDGYRWNPHVFSHQNVVFFPLYPLLMRGIGAAIGGHLLLAAAVISLAAFGAAAALTYRLAALDLGDEAAARAVLLLSTFPYALFFSVGYTESLFLLESVGAFYAMRRGRYAWVAACGVAAGLTRPNGFWLALPLLWIAFANRKSHSSWAVLIAAAMPVVGNAMYSWYLHLQFGDALAWLHGQAAWGMPLLGRRGAPDPPPLPGEPSIKPTEVVTWIGNIAAFILAGAAIRPVGRRLGPAYAIWIAVNIVPPVIAHLFLSIGRFTSVLFPMFFWLARSVPRSRVAYVAGAFAAGQALLAAWFFLWQPVV